MIAPAGAEKPAEENLRGVVMHLIHLLVRKRLLSSAEGEELLRELLQ